MRMTDYLACWPTEADAWWLMVKAELLAIAREHGPRENDKVMVAEGAE